MTISKIIKELENVPKEQFGAVFQMVHALARPATVELSKGAKRNFVICRCLLEYEPGRLQLLYR